MKKIISILLVMFLLTTFCVTSTAGEATNDIYTINNKTIIFYEASVFTADEQQVIAELLANSDQVHSTYGLMCTLFGHKNTSETVETITHCVEAKSPRCLRETFLVTKCSRCGETTTERINYAYISCCPED